jgi:hypothetical protein
MPQYEFDREVRTSESEAFVVRADGDVIGRVDLHYAAELVYATLCVPENFGEDEIQELISEVDERLAMTADPFREDLVATVWIGRQAGVYSEDFETEVDEDVNGDGHR